MKFSDIREMSRDELLKALGLQDKRAASDWILPGLGLFAVGVVIGAGLGVIFAPKSGAELRGELADRLGAGEKAPAATTGSEELVSPGL